MKNIYEIPYGYRLIITRKEMTYRAFFAFGSDQPAALAAAVAARDQFFALHGKFGASGQRPRSNTGIAGISETTVWAHNFRRTCFSVTAGRSQRHQPVRFFYRGLADRQRVLRRAIAHRSRLAGEDATQLLAQAQEVGCA